MTAPTLAPDVGGERRSGVAPGRRRRLWRPVPSCGPCPRRSLSARPETLRLCPACSAASGPSPRGRPPEQPFFRVSCTRAHTDAAIDNRKYTASAATTSRQAGDDVPAAPAVLAGAAMGRGSFLGPPARGFTPRGYIEPGDWWRTTGGGSGVRPVGRCSGPASAYARTVGWSALGVLVAALVALAVLVHQDSTAMAETHDTSGTSMAGMTEPGAGHLSGDPHTSHSRAAGPSAHEDALAGHADNVMNCGDGIAQHCGAASVTTTNFCPPKETLRASTAADPVPSRATVTARTAERAPPELRVLSQRAYRPRVCPGTAGARPQPMASPRTRCRALERRGPIP